MDTEYIVLEEISVKDFSIGGCSWVTLAKVAHRGSSAIKWETLIPDDATIVNTTPDCIKFQYNLDHGIVKMITWTLLPVND